MDNRPRLATFIAVRVIASTLLLGSAILVQVNRPGAFPVDPFFFLIGLTYALSIVYLATVPLVARFPWLLDAQLGIDAVLVSAFIHVTGGITSYFSSLYVLPIIAASRMRSRTGALRVAGLSAALYLLLVSLQYSDAMFYLPQSWQTSDPVELPTGRFAQYTVAINLFGFFAVALLSGSLAESLRSAGARLETASHEIEDLRAFNEYVIDSLLSGLVTTDADCRILTFNRAASTITDVAANDAFGAEIGALLQLPGYFREALATLRETRSLRIDIDHRTPRSRQIQIGLTVTTLSFPGGRGGYLFTFQDVTDVKRLERQARLQQRLAAVGEMAAGIAHEIRNPLASMSGSIQVLRQELPLTDDQAQLMDIVLRESDRLNDTIRSFLAYARPQRQSVSRFDVAKVVMDTAILLRNSPEVRDGHVVDVDVALEEPVWFEADENQIRQILWNLATNGLRAMHSGGRLLMSARMATVSDRGELVLAVQDEGCGVPAEEIDGMFQPFHSTFEKGTGLGLATVHRIVTDYGGAIQVQSTVAVGTTISVRLPIRGPFGATTVESRSGEPRSAAS